MREKGERGLREALGRSNIGTMIKSNITYHEFLKSPEWFTLRENVKARDHNQCRVCNKKTELVVHHKTYERWRLCLSEDLMTVCKKCHEKIHFDGGKKIELTKESLKKRLKKINKARSQMPKQPKYVFFGISVERCRRFKERVSKVHRYRDVKKEFTRQEWDALHYIHKNNPRWKKEFEKYILPS